MRNLGKHRLGGAEEGEEGGGYENPMRLSMYVSQMESVQYTWVDIWCILD